MQYMIGLRYCTNWIRRIISVPTYKIRLPKTRLPFPPGSYVHDRNNTPHGHMTTFGMYQRSPLKVRDSRDEILKPH